jgi:Polysaccharide lyase/Concanavalin A-like lectin/glucanases superfamily
MAVSRVAFVGASAVRATDGTGPTAITPHASTSIGDLMLFFHYSRTTGTNEVVTWPRGWTEVCQYRDTTGGLIAVASRIRQSGDTTALATVSNHTTGTSGEAILEWIETYRGADTVVASTSASIWGARSTNIGAINLNSAGDVEAGGMVVVFGGRKENVTAQTTLTGDGLTWAQGTRGDTSSGLDAGAVTQTGYNDTDRAITPTAKTIASTGTAEVGKGVMIVISPAAVTPISQWDLDGNVNDSVGANNGSARGSPTYAAPLVSAEPSGQSIDLNGSSQFVEVADHASLRLTKSFWITAWVERGDTTVDQTIFDKGDDDFFLLMLAGNGVQTGYRDSGGTYHVKTLASDIIRCDRPYRLDGTWDGANLRIYVNGRIIGAPDPQTALIRTTTGVLQLGAWTGRTLWNGRADKIRLRDSAPPDFEILDEYRAESLIVFEDDFETGDLSRWATLQEVGTGADTAPSRTDPTPWGGTYGLRTTLGSRAERAEIVPGETLFSDGDDIYVHFKLRLKSPFPSDDDPPWWGSLFFQLRDEGDGSPVVALGVEGRTPIFTVTGGPATGIDTTRYWASPALEQDRWYDFIVYILCSEDRAVGRVQVWMDGVRQTMTNDTGRTAFGLAYPKFGMYRDTDITITGVVGHDEIEIVRALPERPVQFSKSGGAVRGVYRRYTKIGGVLTPVPISYK